MMLFCLQCVEYHLNSVRLCGTKYMLAKVIIVNWLTLLLGKYLEVKVAAVG